MIRQAGAVLLLVLSTAVASGGDDTGNDLYGFCQQQRVSYQFGLCVGLVTGYFQQVHFFFKCREDDNVTRAQLVDVVVKYLRENPKDRNKSAQILGSAAIALAFNCTKRPLDEFKEIYQ
jgi:hypothetical protein